MNLLTTMKSLLIVDNPFTDFQGLVSVLSTIPNLENLGISLSQKEEVVLILSNLQNLKLLNGESNYLIEFRNR